MGELRSLSRESFDLDAAPPTCTVEVAYSKRCRQDGQPLPRALVAPLRAWLAGFEPGRPVFEGIARDTARMPRTDPRPAGVHTRSAREGSVRHSRTVAVPFDSNESSRLNERQSQQKRSRIKTEGTGFEPATPFGASDFESDR